MVQSLMAAKEEAATASSDLTQLRSDHTQLQTELSQSQQQLHEEQTKSKVVSIELKEANIKVTSVATCQVPICVGLQMADLKNEYQELDKQLSAAKSQVDKPSLRSHKEFCHNIYRKPSLITLYRLYEQLIL